MGVRSAPWWLTALLAAGLFALFLGERIFGDTIIARAVLSGVGSLCVVGATAWRALSWTRAEGEVRRIEGIFLLSYVGCVIALILYALSSEEGMRLFGIHFDSAQAERRYERGFLVLWSILLTVSLLPALGAQWAVGLQRHAQGAGPSVEALRVTETATSALTVALAGAFLMLVGYIASEEDKTLDLSYFKTSSPGSATQEMARSMAEPLEVALFFPEINEVKDEVIRYFRQLEAAGGRLQLVEYDRLASPEIARELSAREDGTVVLRRGEQTERLVLPAELRSARGRLRTFDREVQSALMRILRERRVAYLTTGHGELNDPSSAEAPTEGPLNSVDALRGLLQLLNYQVEDLGLGQGLGNEIPGDAGLVLVLGPERPFLQEELGAVDQYLERGGRLLLALDPDTEFELGPLEDRLGVRYQAVSLADDQQHLRQRGNLSDRLLIITDRFSAHASVTTLSRSQGGSGILLVGAGHLEATEEAGEEEAGDEPNFVVRSLPSTFADRNGNFTFDDDETRSSYNLVAAVEEEREDEGRPTRALVFADSETFSDGVLVSLGLNAALVADGVRWLGGDEAFAGETTSEEDVPIVHTRAEDVAWFYSIIFGAPAIVLFGGLALVFVRRSRSRRGAAV